MNNLKQELKLLKKLKILLKLPSLIKCPKWFTTKLSNLTILYLIASNKDLLISNGSLTKIKSINVPINLNKPEIKEANIIELNGKINLKVSIKKLPKKLPNKIQIPEIKLW
jgi:hypothetical protein